MKTNLSDLIAALPQEEDGPELLESAEAQERLEEIFAELAYKPIPVHSLHRMWTMGELSTQIALAYASLWIRGLFADAKTRERQSIETNLRVALKMVHRLGYLRGAAIKLGQAFGSLPELLPSQVVSTMDMLHAQAPPMHFSLIREVFRSEFGKEPSELFASFDKEAFAAASIGQVHRATLKSGEEVAVKIQYPGIGRAIQADLRNLTALIFPTRLSKRAESVKGQVEAIRDMLEQEMDYVREARTMREVSALFTPADGIAVPRVFGEFSTSRILTSEYIPGPNLAQFLAANPSEKQRDEFGRKISLAWYRMYYAHTNYSDPHSGNYVFMSDGRLGLLDFGCVQRFTQDDMRLCEIGDDFIDGRITFEEMMLRSGHAKADVAREDYMGPCRRHQEWLTAPAFHDGAFDLGDSGFFQQGIDSMKEMVEKIVPAPPMYLYFYRSLFGLRVLSYQLKCRVDIAGLRRQERKPWTV